MKNTVRITILSATDRPGSNALKIAHHITPLYEENGAQVNIVSLEDFPLEEVIGGHYGKKLPRIEAFREQVINTDGLVMIVPEYNGSFPGILKLFIDYLPFPESFDKMPIAFIGEAAGAFGALRSVEQIQVICGYRNAHLFPERVFFQRVSSLFNEEEGIRDELTADLIKKQAWGFTRFVSKIRELKQA